ncbi:YidC/Oxa1 family insertase periplasmic-domain containing protein [Aeoliella sp.]|uniref:YidC/Oxa1 family insertase periplasmic-domain containing protein n=1 Tax=Aeoliella sp. TaxID=2795800 RepID=UPI003CCB9526
MDRKYIAFFAGSFAIIVIWQILFPPPVPVKPKDPAAAAAGEGGDEKDPGDEGQQDPAAEEKEDEGDEAAPAPPVIAAPVVDSPHYLTLGSIAPQGPYRFAATFDSHGATIRRLELSSTRYRDLHERHGFLGQLELESKPAGVEVQVVPPGSPAADANLEPGDLITAITVGTSEAVEIGEVADVERLLERTRPGQSVSIEVTRSGNKQSLTTTLIRKPLDVIRPEQENILLHSKKVPDDFEQHPTCEISLTSVGPNEPGKVALALANEQLRTGVWAVDDTQADQLTFSMVLPDLGLEVIKRFTIAAVPEEQLDDRDYPGYHVDVEVSVRNLLPSPQTVSYELQGPNGLPIEGFWYAQKVGRGWSGYGIRDVVRRTFGNSVSDDACRNIADDDVKPYGDGQSLAYIGVDAQYFAAAMIPQKMEVDDRWYTSFDPSLGSTKLEAKSSYQERYQNASFTLESNPLKLAAAGEEGDTAGRKNQLFAGPKHPELLAEYQSPAAPAYSLEGFVYYGWFGSLGIPQAMVSILAFFYSIVRNYGLAIILLTVVVRSCMLPLSRKQAKNMAMMQELKPEMDRITSKYKDDPQARMKAQQELWGKHNYNPMGGCLLMFIQLPIFIGLYRALSVDVDLREAALIPGIRWCSNLAAPDMLMSWRNFIWPQWFLNGEGMFALGPYLNILPLVTVGLFLLQQKMFMPPPADEQQEMMQKVMKFMMLFMSFMFFKVASGLCLYFIASSLWGMAERKLVPKPNVNIQPAAPEKESSRRKKSTPNASAIKAAKNKKKKR